MILSLLVINNHLIYLLIEIMILILLKCNNCLIYLLIEIDLY